jgi:hypothetical protein
MSSASAGRRRSDDPGFVETDVDVESLADRIFAAYSGPQRIVTEGAARTATFFSPDYCPDYRVMKLAGALAIAVNRRSQAEPDGDPAQSRSNVHHSGIEPLRVTVREIMLAALLHDLGKHHEDCSPFLERVKHMDLRGGTMGDADRQRYLLSVVRDVHCRKGPCMIDRLRDGGHKELHNPFIATVARRHGDDYKINRTACWWPREINVITIADDYDAVTSAGPERAYKSKTLTREEAVEMLRESAARGRYEPHIADIFIDDVLGEHRNQS